MAMKKLYDCAVATREYTNSAGETKKNWVTVGAVVEYDDGGKSLLIEKWFNPAGIVSDRSSIRISLFEPKPREGTTAQPARTAQSRPQSEPTAQPATPEYDDDIPF